MFTALPTGTGPAALSFQLVNFLEVLVEGAMVLYSLFTSQGERLHFAFYYARVPNNRLGIFFLLELIYLGLSYFSSSC